MPASRADETSLVVAAQAGDPRALDDLAAAYLPLVYTIVRRALGGLPDVDDVVQETMLRALRELRTLRTPESFRPWLATIATRQVSSHLHRRQVDAERTAPLDEVTHPPDADTESLALVYAELSGHRRQAVRASRWLDPDDRALLSLWWLEAAGQLTRTELAAALGTTVAHAGVRVQRMRHQLELSRSLVAALEASPRCAQLAAALEGWDGVPSPLWRKRITRHTRSCRVCARAADGLVPLERLIAGLALLPVPLALSAAVLAKGTLAGTAVGAFSGATGSGAVAAGVKAGILGHLTQTIAGHPVATAVTAVTLVAGAAVTTATWNAPAPPGRPVVAAPTSAPPPAPVGSAPAVAPPPLDPEPVAPSPKRPSPTVASPSGPFAAGFASLEPVNAAGLVVTTADDLGVLDRVDAGTDAPGRERATFEVVPGLADPSCISFRARDGRYLRHASWRLRLSRDEGTELFRGDATFCVRAGSAPDSVSFESSNYPAAFVRHRGTELWVDWPDGSAAFRADASFRPLPPLAR